MLQIVEGCDLAVAQDQQLAIERDAFGHLFQDVGKRAADVVARAGIDPLFATAGHELDADAVPLPFREVVAWVEPVEIAFLDRLRASTG